MRILTLLAGADALGDVARLTGEIRSFNAEIDFRLRFLHIEIEEIYVVDPGLRDRLGEHVDHAEVREVAADPPLEAAARLALVCSRERPDVLVVAGDGPLRAPGAAAARACGVRLASFGAGEALGEDSLDLGNNPPEAVARLTGVAREIR